MSAGSNVVELGQPVTLVLPRSLHAQLADAARTAGIGVDQEAVTRLVRSFQRRRASDQMDEFLNTACRPED